MCVKEVVLIALKYFKKVYKNKNISNVLLEEVTSKKNKWKITIGFNVGNIRKYKIIKIKQKFSFKEIKIRNIEE